MFSVFMSCLLSIHVVLFPVYTCCFACFILPRYLSHLGLCPFSRLVCDLLLRLLKGYSPESALPEGHPESQSERALLGGHQSRGALPTLVGRHPVTIMTGAKFLGS